MSLKQLHRLTDRLGQHQQRFYLSHRSLIDHTPGLKKIFGFEIAIFSKPFSILPYRRADINEVYLSILRPITTRCLPPVVFYELLFDRFDDHQVTTRPPSCHNDTHSCFSSVVDCREWLLFTISASGFFLKTLFLEIISTIPIAMLFATICEPP